MQSPSLAYTKAPSSRRWGLLFAGILGAIFAIFVLLVSFVFHMGAAAISTVAPLGKARTPAPITFEAEAARYELYAVHERWDNSIGSGARFDCTVTLANSAEIAINGAVQAVSTEVANTQSIGAFQAVPGKTVIRCDAGRNGEIFLVEKESPWKQANLIATVLAVVLLLASAGAIVAGALWKRQTPVTR